MPKSRGSAGSRGYVPRASRNRKRISAEVIVRQFNLGRTLSDDATMDPKDNLRGSLASALIPDCRPTRDGRGQ